MKKRQTIEDLIKEKAEQKELRNKMNIENKDTKIIVEKKNIFLQLLNFLENVFIKLLRLISILSISILSTIGLTVLINQSLREMLFSLIKNAI